jgi:hypothetical protein
MRSAPGFVRVSGSQGGQLRRLGATSACIVCGMPGLPGVLTFAHIYERHIGSTVRRVSSATIGSNCTADIDLDWDIQANSLSYLVRCSTCLPIQSNSRSAICRLFLSSMNMCVLP